MDQGGLNALRGIEQGGQEDLPPRAARAPKSGHKLSSPLYIPAKGVYAAG